MNEDRPGRSGYHIPSRVLARKGGAEPLPTTGKPVVLAPKNHRIPTDDEHLAAALTDATVELLVGRPKGDRIQRGAAPLTDLLDPALVDAARRKRGESER